MRLNHAVRVTPVIIIVVPVVALLPKQWLEYPITAIGASQGCPRNPNLGFRYPTIRLTPTPNKRRRKERRTQRNS